MQSVTRSVIRVSPNPRQWSTNNSDQPSVILQHALTSPSSQQIEPDNTQGSKSKQRIVNLIAINFYWICFAGALYCVVPPAQEKNLMIIKNEPENDLKEQKPFHRQVLYSTKKNDETLIENNVFKVIQSDHLQATQTIRVASNNLNTHSTNSGLIHSNSISAGLPVIVNPTQLVPVLPSTAQSVVKRVIPTATIQQNPPPVIVKTEQGNIDTTFIYFKSLLHCIDFVFSSRNA